MNSVRKHLISFSEIQKNTEIFAQDKKNLYSSKEKSYSIRAVISIVGKFSDWLIIYYTANQNFKFVYIDILWGLKITYLHLSVYFYLF